MSSLQTSNQYDLENQPTHIYYNLNLINNSVSGNTAPQQLVFTDSRNGTAILTYPKHYYASITRFSIDTGADAIPVFIPSIDTTQTLVNKTVYEITLSYKTSNFTQAIIYVPTDTTQPTPRSPLGGVDYTTTYYYIYSYQKWVKMINTALAAAVTGLNAASIADGNGALPSLNVPFVEIDPINLTMLINADQAVYAETLAFPVQIYFNTAFFNIMTFFQYTRYGVSALFGKNYLLNVYLNNNTTTIGGIVYLQMYQEGSCMSLLNPVQSIVITSNAPNYSEIIGIPSIFNSTTNFQNPFNAPNTSPIFTDFQVPITALDSYRPSIFYNPTGEYRLCDMQSTSPIYNIQLFVYWMDKFGNYHPILLPGGCSANIKIMFRRKDFNQRSL
jgi:hypothetical protein